MLADEVNYVVGVDTHRDRHAVAIVGAQSGAVMTQTMTAASTSRGYADAVRFASQHGPGDRLWAVEGSSHYGAGLIRHLPTTPWRVVREVDRTGRGERRALPPTRDEQATGSDLMPVMSTLDESVPAGETLVQPHPGQTSRGFLGAAIA